VERDKRRQEAKIILNRLITDKRDSYPFVLKAKLLLDELDGRLGEKDHDDDYGLVADLIRDIQSVLTTYRQQFSGDTHLSSVEARFATAMNEHPRAMAILEQAHKADKHTAFLAIRLSEKYSAEGRTDDAIRVLSQTLKAGGPNKDIHLSIAECYRAMSEVAHCNEISDHLRRSFSDGDSRYRARYLYARHEFLFGDRAKARAEFSALQKVRVPPRTIASISDVVRGSDGSPRRFEGTVTQAPKPSYAFLHSVELDCDVYIDRRALRTSWDLLRKGASVSFSLSFSFRGPLATDASEIGRQMVAAT
jgi:tetratricopeptide (TPR) repeat protein